MKHLSIDIETFSSVDLKSAGMYAYAESPDFEVLLLAYSLNGGPVKIVDLASGEPLGYELTIALTDPHTIKHAWNAAFERTCLAAHLGVPMPPEQWRCTMAKAAQVGLPLSLEQAGKVLELDQQKLREGKALIKYFCTPCKPTKANGQRTRNLPADAPEKWAEFKDYCVRDVEVEMNIANKIAWFEVPATEVELWNLDQRINDRGVKIDRQFVNSVLEVYKKTVSKLTEEAARLTGLDNPNSVAQLKNWLLDKTGEEVSKLDRHAVKKLIKDATDETVERVMVIRQELSKSSVKKYPAMLKMMQSDDRVRGLFKYCGANRTRRWSGQKIQPQNLTKHRIGDLEFARELVLKGDIEMLELCYGNTVDILSQLIRTAFIAENGKRFMPADFAAIEARVIAWLSGEAWRMEVFRTHGKIYEASASQMFRVPIEKVTKDSEFRKRGKISELALGFGGAVGALTQMEISMEVPEADRIPEEEKPRTVALWRKASPKIVKLWSDMEYAAIETVKTGQPHGIRYGLKFFMKKGVLMMQLPSGGCLSYLRPRVAPGKFGKDALSYDGIDQVTKKWGRVDTWGGKLVENAVQGIARDLLAENMLKLDKANYDLVMHVHDEAIPEMPYGQGSIEEVNRIMGTPIPWAPGLPLKAESYETPFYKKD